MTKLVWVAFVVGLAACGKVLPLDNPDGGDDVDADPCAAPNVCECTVATQSVDCGAHQICDETGPGRVCACAPAYADDGTGACSFSGAPDDPGFQATDKWLPLGNGASVNPATAGNLDPGEGIFNRIGMCNAHGLKQTFVMPPLALADQYKLTVSVIGIDPNFELFGTQLSVGVNGEFHEINVNRNAYTTAAFCLGPRAYGAGPTGGPVDFIIGTYGSPNCASASTATIQVDQVKLELAAPGECPAPNTVINGDMELASGWTFSTPIQAATGAFVPNGGENGTQGIRLTGSNKCSEISVTGTIAIPDNIANPAIDVFFQGTSGTRLTASLSGTNIGILSGVGGAGLHKRICIPKWAVGNTATFGLFMQRASDNGCSTALARTFVVDNVTLTDDPACAPADILDPGFEFVATANGPVTSWGLTNGYVNDNEGSTATILNNASLAHTGSRSLRLVGANECVLVGAGGADFAITVPPPNGAAGPALKFFANVGNANLKTTTRIATVPPNNLQGSLRLDLPETGVYQQHVFCLPPTTVGRRLNFRFSTGDSDGGGCGANYADEVALIDDVELTTDASCAAQ